MKSAERIPGREGAGIDLTADAPQRLDSALDTSPREGCMKATIFAVDDDPVFLKMLRKALIDAGYEPVTTDDPTKALPLAERCQPDVVVLDIVMPDLSGWDLLDALRDRPFTRSVPVIMLSALGEPTDRVRAVRSGADDYLVKPLDPTELLVRIEMQLARARREDADLQGRLETYPMAELIQSLELHARTGELTVSSGASTGKIRLREGRLQRASYDLFEGPTAVRAILELGSGRFRFRPMAVEASGRPGEGQSFLPFLMEQAWVRDELNSRGFRLPPSDAPLAVRGNCGEIGPQHAQLPILAIMDYLEEQPGATIASILEQRFDSPQRVELALVWLDEHDLLEVSEPQEAGAEIAEALSRFVDDAVEAGFDRGSLRVLVLAEAQSWGSVNLLLGEIPPNLLPPDGHLVVERICIGQSGELDLAAGKERLTLRFATLGLDPVPRWLDEACALVLWRGPGEGRQLDPVATKLAGRIDPQARLLMVGGEDGEWTAPLPWGGFRAQDPRLEDLLQALVDEAGAFEDTSSEG